MTKAGDDLLGTVQFLAAEDEVRCQGVGVALAHIPLDECLELELAGGRMQALGRIVMPILGGIFLAFLFQNCSQANFSTPTSDAASVSPSPSPAPAPSSTNSSSGTVVSPPTNPSNLPVICDPLSGGSSCGANSSGLLGNLYFLTTAQVSQYGDQFATYVNHGTRLPVQIQMSNFDIPSHSFSNGFSVPGGAALRDSSGNVLTTYFGMDLYGHFKLTADYASGYYQFATTSDDGSNALLDGQVIVNNDGEHAMSTAYSQPILLTVGQIHAFHLEYFQGPPVEIGFQVSFRHCTSSAVSSCTEALSIIPAEMLTP